MRSRLFSLVWFVATFVVVTLIAAHAGADPDVSIERDTPAADAPARRDASQAVPVFGLYGL